MFLSTVLVICFISYTTPAQAADKIVQFERHLLRLAKENPCTRILDVLTEHYDQINEIGGGKPWLWRATIGDVPRMHEGVRGILEHSKGILCAAESEKITSALQRYYNRVFERLFDSIMALPTLELDKLLEWKENLLETYKNMASFIKEFAIFKNVVITSHREKLIEQWLKGLNSKFSQKAGEVIDNNSLIKWESWYNMGMFESTDLEFTEAEKKIIKDAEHQKYENVLQGSDNSLKDRKYRVEDLRRHILPFIITDVIAYGRKNSDDAIIKHGKSLCLYIIKYYFSKVPDALSQAECAYAVNAVKEGIIQLKNLIDESMIKELMAELKIFVQSKALPPLTAKDQSCRKAVLELIQVMKTELPTQFKELESLKHIVAT